MTKQIWDKIKEYSTVIILRHISPDGDAYGVQFGLKHLIVANLPHIRVLTGGVSLLDLNYIGICDDVKEEDYRDALVIIGDCANAERIDGVGWEKGKYKIKIDHHPFYEQYGDLEWIDDVAPSASEMVAKLALDNNLQVTKEAAKAIFHGMVTDTGRFLYGNLRPETFLLANFLMTTGFNIEQLYNNLYQRPMNIIKFQAFALSNFTVTDNGVAFLKLTPDILKEFLITKEKANNLVNLLGRILGIHIWAFCSQDENDEFIKISIRSTGLKINDLAAQYGGGGHHRAAGVKTNSWHTVDALLNDLNLLAKNINQSEGK
ncbi:bifunctional oligoribonuclease/PAP phosphatase NrnA [Spiroplasma endosymbiont of Eupeodes luniger]|uniref:DHH family phosphoesterase n=1 Tax=Spiroplasma endosymbiont of Eupeodes luniger TaxID=3066300 RepID=UPI0030CB8411